MQEHDPSVRDCSASGVSKARNLFERALTAGGLHFSEGSNIWEAYKEFEQAICLLVDDSNTEVCFVISILMISAAVVFLYMHVLPSYTHPHLPPPTQKFIHAQHGNDSTYMWIWMSCPDPR